MFCHTLAGRGAAILLLLLSGGTAHVGAQNVASRKQVITVRSTTAVFRNADTELIAKVDRLVKPLVDGEVVSSLVIGLVEGDKTTILGYGQVSSSHPGKPDGDTLYEIGSITKVFTGTLLADMVERKQAALDDPVAKYLPAAAKVPAFEGRQITLLDLTTQSSGLPRLPDNLAPKHPANPYADYTADNLLAFLAGHKLARKPGEKYEYSNLGVGLLGYALAQKAGTSYEALVKSRICEPLGMKSTVITLTPELRTHLAQGHDVEGNAVANWDFDALVGAGGLRSSVNDMLRFLRANLGEPSGSLQNGLLLAQKPQRPLDGPGHIGLNWHILPDAKTVWHNGGTGGYHSLLAFNRDTKRGVVVLCGTSSDVVDTLGFDLLRVLSGENPDPPQVRLPARIDTALYARYVGDYELAPGIILTVTREKERLLAQLTGQPKFRLYPASETEFFYRVVDAQLTFGKDGNGKVEKLTLHQNGQNIPAKKIK